MILSEAVSARSSGSSLRECARTGGQSRFFFARCKELEGKTTLKPTPHNAHVHRNRPTPESAYKASRMGREPGQIPSDAGLIFAGCFAVTRH